MDDDEINEYAWEGDIGKAWRALTDDNAISSTIQDEMIRKVDRKNYMDKLNSYAETRSMIRYLTLIIDLSSSMKLTDMKPTRLAVTKVHLKKFIKDYFDQNPLSLISILTTSGGKSMIISYFFNSPNEHIEKLHDSKLSDGDPSLQNALELSVNCFQEVPKYAYKEVLVISSSMITCDPGNIYDTMKLLKENSIKVSIISLSAEVFIFKKI